MRRGATLAVTEMTPRAPKLIKIDGGGIIARQQRELRRDRRSAISRARFNDPVASLIATICGLSRQPRDRARHQIHRSAARAHCTE